MHHAVKKRDEGADIEAVRDYIESIKLNLCHLFTVDDLFFLKRGGRVSAATAVVGSALGIKPMMHVVQEMPSPGFCFRLEAQGLCTTSLFTEGM